MLRANKKKMFILMLLPLFWAGCSSKNVGLNPGQIDLKKAKEYQEAGRYELAIENYTNIKNKYPLSPEAVEAELELSETYYLQGSYVEARAGFEAFRDLHPRHEKADFALFRIAMSHYKETPSTIDRDLQPAFDAISAFDTFLKTYPKSSHVKEAQEKREDCRKKLAEKELYIANFYFKMKQYEAAAGRFRTILKKYRGVDFEEKALFHLAMCYHELKDKKSEKETLDLFLKEFPNSTFTTQAKSMLKDL